METDPPNVTDVSTPATINNLLLKPVSPCASGEGFPYAPVDWPNPGDIWIWKVGCRIRKSGYYSDRFLIVPDRLKESLGRRLWFGNKKALARFLLSKFKDVDIDTFFASFSWHVPSEEFLTTKGQSEGRGTNLRKRKQNPAIFPRGETRSSSAKVAKTIALNRGVTHDLCSMSEGTETNHSSNYSKSSNEFDDTHIHDPLKDLKSGTESESAQVSGCHPSISHCPSDAARESSTHSFREIPTEAIQEDFDVFINSLDGILAQPIPEDPVFSSTSGARTKVVKIRERLSLLISMDFPKLVSFNLLPEVTILSYKIQKDASLSAEQKSVLKLIDLMEIAGEDYLQSKNIVLQAAEFFTICETNIARVNRLKDEYDESKEKISFISTELDSFSSAIQNVDDQIAILLSQRAEYSATMEVKKKELSLATSAQKKVVECLPKVVHEVKLANSVRAEWELKRKMADEKMTEILAKLAPLRGFSL